MNPISDWNTNCGDDGRRYEESFGCTHGSKNGCAGSGRGGGARSRGSSENTSSHRRRRRQRPNSGSYGHGEDSGRYCTRQGGLNLAGHLFAEHLAPAGQALLQGILADPDRLGRYPHRLALAVIKDERQPISLRQFCQLLAHQGRFFFAGGGFVWLRRVVCYSQAILQNVMSWFPPQLTERGITGDLAEPAPQSLRFAQLMKFPPCRQKRLLPGILTRREISQNSERDPAHHRLMPCDDFYKRPLVPPARCMHQFRVRPRRAAFRLACLVQFHSRSPEN